VNNLERYNQFISQSVQRFDQKKDMFRRIRLEPEWIARADEFKNIGAVLGKRGYNQEGYALTASSWYVEDVFASGNSGATEKGLYSDRSLIPEGAGMPPGMRIDTQDKAEVTKKIKRAAKLYGASLVGICEVNERWIYSHSYNDRTNEHREIEFPEGMKYAIAIAIEMDYKLIQTVPSSAGCASTGTAYSRMAFTSGLLAEFIRNLGYRAVASGNNTGLSIPIAIEAGLGEIGRNGILITEEFGPRVRLCKVFTDIPLIPDGPKYIGVSEFCSLCRRCADKCPSRAITKGERSWEGATESNNPGVFKWYINPESCFSFWAASKTDCAVCIRVCPFNQKKGKIHGFFHFLIRRRNPLLNRMILHFINISGHGKRKNPETAWD
jgi:reductive dehalogenase